MRGAARYCGRLTAAGAIVAVVIAGLAANGCGVPRPAPPHSIAVVVAGHEEVEVQPNGTLLPVVIKGPVGLCVTPASSVDTGQWVARLELDGVPVASQPAAPTARSGATVCFSAPLPAGLRPGAVVDLCGEVTDRFDGSTRTLPCRQLRFRPDMVAYDVLTRAMRDVYGRRDSMPLGDMLAALDGLAERSQSAGFPLLAVRLELVAVHFLKLEGTADAVGRARERFARMPAWIRQEEAAAMGLVVAYEEAAIERELHHPRAAWRLLDDASRLGRKVASPRLLLVGMLQGDILADEGLVPTAIDHVTTALESCGSAPCEPRLLPDAKEQLAWLLLNDPDASEEKLALAGKWLVEALEGLTGSRDPLVRANQLINLTFLDGRLGRAVDAHLAEARSLLSSAPMGETRRRFLLGWTDLVEGLAHLEAGRLDAALLPCGRAAGAAGFPDLAARGASCCGRAWAGRGKREKAAAMFDQAIRLREFASREEEGRSVSAVVGALAEDYYRAARVSIDRGDAARAFALLTELDEHVAEHERRRMCREMSTDPAAAARWREVEDETSRLLAELATMPVLASSGLRSDLAAVRRTLLERLQTLWRELPGCPERSQPRRLTGAGYRAFAVDDVIVLLHRDGNGGVRVVRETALSRQRIRELTDRIADALEQRTLDERTWCELVRPLAVALVPSPVEALPAILPMALHGRLQAVPVAALPLPGPERGPLRFLADGTTVIMQPAGVSGEPVVSAGLSGEGLAVVDPLGNLAGGQEQVALLSRRFPSATIERGESATRAVVRAGLARAAWVHFDGHGRFDAAFPELSSLALADGPLTILDLEKAPIAVRFANLNGCQTGRWPYTAGSGHYGLAGVLARRGVSWVVASRATLEDRVASLFNQEFYAAAAAGRPIPEAFRTALGAVRREHPPARWAGLLLLWGAEDGENGRTTDSLRGEGR